MSNLKSYDQDLIERLRDPEYAAAYLNAVLSDDEEAGVEERFLIALRDVAKAHGISQISEESDLNRQNLYKILSENGNPELRTLTILLGTIGLRLSVEKKVS